MTKEKAPILLESIGATYKEARLMLASVLLPPSEKEHQPAASDIGEAAALDLMLQAAAQEGGDEGRFVIKAPAAIEKLDGICVPQKTPLKEKASRHFGLHARNHPRAKPVCNVRLGVFRPRGRLRK